MLSVISINEAEKWDDIVSSFKDYDINFLSGYAKAFQLAGNGEPQLFYYDDGNTRAMNVVMKRDIADDINFKNLLPANTWFDLSTPYGYGGFWMDGDNYKAVNAAYDEYCREHGYVCEFVRFHLFGGYERYYNGIVESHTHNVVRSLEIPLDEIQKSFEHKVRKNLKKANSYGLQIEIDTNGEKLKDFLNIYYSTMKRSNAADSFFFLKSFFETLNRMEGQYAYFHVLSEGQVISTELVIYGTENCYSFLGGTNEDYFHMRPNDFLKYEIIKWGQEKGLKRFILGGGYGSDDGIFRYKKGLAPDGIYDFYIGKKIFDNEKYEILLNKKKSEISFDGNVTFFPAYRAIFGEKEKDE